MNATPVDTTTQQSSTSTADESVVDRWIQIPGDYSESNLAANLVSFMFEKLGVKFDNIKNQPNIGSGLRPDYLIHQDSHKSPVLVVEIKRRIATLGSISDKNFAGECEQHTLYREAIGFGTSKNNNGIRQYLEIGKVQEQYLAPYGLVFNGDFFQLWRRADGLVFPLRGCLKSLVKKLPKPYAVYEN